MLSWEIPEACSREAVAIWQALDGPDQCGLVSLYLQRAGFASVEARELAPPSRWGADPLWAVVGRTAEDGNAE